MDKQGHRLTGKETEFLRSFQEQDLEKDDEAEEAPRKITLSEYMSSPEFQRGQKIASEAADRSAFEAKMAFRIKVERSGTHL